MLQIVKGNKNRPILVQFILLQNEKDKPCKNFVPTFIFKRFGFRKILCRKLNSDCYSIIIQSTKKRLLGL